MNAISKEAILGKTHYGLNIYAHILRYYYSGETVLSISGRACAPARNPFNNDKSTLLISVENNIAIHRDSENAIPAGDVFGFAELHYKQQDEELLQTLNKELYLHIGEKRDFYTNKRTALHCPKSPYSPLFSFFKAPISNITPHSETTLRKVYNAIVGDYYKDRTLKLQAISDVQQARKFKAVNFDYCTFSGVFQTRNDKALVKHSGLLAVDFDHLNTPSLLGRDGVGLLRQALLADEYFDTQLLFVSPSGNGLKWIIPIDTAVVPHGEYFAAVANYIKQTYGVEVDKSGRDISRACFLSHDPAAFINPLLK